MCMVCIVGGFTHGQYSNCVDSELIILAVTHDCGCCSCVFECVYGWNKKEEEGVIEVGSNPGTSKYVKILVRGDPRFLLNSEGSGPLLLLCTY